MYNMKNKLSFFCLLIFSSILIFAFVPRNEPAVAAPAEKGEGGIKFMEANWAKALQEAKKQNKLIFLDAYTSWCGPCRMLKNNTFPDKAAGEFYNQHFINVALDMEQGDGIAVGGKYGVNAYPTLIIADANGNMLTYTKGYIDAKQLIEFGKFGLSKK